MPTSEGRAPERLVVLVPNDFTALAQSLAAPLVRVLSDGRPSLVFADRPNAVTRVLEEQAYTRVQTPEWARLPDMGRLRIEFGLRQDFLVARLEEDRFLKGLALPGAEAGGSGVFVWDRLQWMMAARDPRSVLETLPWSSLREIVLIGGQPQPSMLPTLIVSQACRRGLRISGWLKGPLMGRWAPLWVHACDRLMLGLPEQAEEVARRGLMVATEIAPELDPSPAVTPLRLVPRARRSLLLDLDGSTWHALVRPALKTFLQEAGDAVEEVVLPMRPGQRERLHQLYGESLAGCPIRPVEGSATQLYLREPRPVLSFDPYTLWHAAPALGGVEVGVLAAEVRAVHGGEPASLAPFMAAPGAARAEASA